MGPRGELRGKPGVVSGRKRFHVWLALVGALLQVPLLAVATSAQQAALAHEIGDEARALTNRSLDCLRRGEAGADREAKFAAYREGLALARQAIELEEANADAHFAAFANQGRIFLLEGVSANFMNLLRVSRDLDRALELNPNHADALAAKGGLHHKLPWVLGGDRKKAETYLKRSIELDANTVLPRIELAEMYREMGTPERSIPLLKEAVVLATRQNKPYRVEEARKLLRELDADR